MMLEDVVMMITLPAFAAWALWLLYRRHELKARLRLERAAALNRLIEKAQSTQEIVSFLDSDVSRRLFDEPGSEVPSRAYAVRFVMGGIILAMLGAAFLVSARVAAVSLGPQPDMNSVREILEKREWAILFLSLALSLWLVALVHHVADRRRP